MEISRQYAGSAAMKVSLEENVDDEKVDDMLMW